MESSQEGTTVFTYSRFIQMILNELGQALHYLVIGIVLLLITQQKISCSLVLKVKK